MSSSISVTSPSGGNTANLSMILGTCDSVNGTVVAVISNLGLVLGNADYMLTPSQAKKCDLCNYFRDLCNTFRNKKPYIYGSKLSHVMTIKFKENEKNTIIYTNFSCSIDIEGRRLRTGTQLGDGFQLCAIYGSGSL